MRLGDIDAVKEKLLHDSFCSWHDFNTVMHVLDEAPTIDAVPMKHGRWVFGVDKETGERDLKAWTCSECNEKYPWQPNYCPHCGAKMDGEKVSE